MCMHVQRLTHMHELQRAIIGRLDAWYASVHAIPCKWPAAINPFHTAWWCQNGQNGQNDQEGLLWFG